MSLNINYLNVTIWILGGTMTLFALTLIIWRIFFKGKSYEGITANSKNIGSVSKDFNEFVISLMSTSNFDIVYNILLKNKFSTLKFSILPALIFVNKVPFLLTNIISSKKASKLIIDKNLPFPVLNKNNNNAQITNVDFRWTKDIKRYLKSHFPNVDFQVIIPIVNSNIKIENNRNLCPVYIENFENELIKIAETRKQLSLHQKNKIIKSITNSNQFKSKVSVTNTLLSKGGN